MKAEILKLISDEEVKIKECERALVNVESLSDERFNTIMAVKGVCESSVEKLKALLK
jgi:hypothetical protein